MNLQSTKIDGIYVVHFDVFCDERGTFTRTFDAEQFIEAGLDPNVAQSSVSFNHAEGTLRGMHLQQNPYSETKLVRCTSGRIYDVAVDSRLGSKTLGEWVALELSPEAKIGLVLTPGIAHGFLTLTPSAEVSYQISVPYQPDATAGFHWSDDQIGIPWPAKPTVVSERDDAMPSFGEFKGTMASWQ